MVRQAQPTRTASVPQATATTAGARAPRRARNASRADEAPLGAVSVDEFLRRHWQRKPLLVRQALPGIKPPLEAQALIELAGDDAVQSRLVTSFGGRWKLEHGPFDADSLPPLSRRQWTLLVQGVNLHDDLAHALMSRFRFIPDARLDDLMISLASDRGGVGPHLDSYDVFLVQLWGRRRWRIAPPGNDRFRPGLPLKILEQFEPTEEWLLEPGDMLYLPPGWAHDGIAEGPCMTGSIGFRAPSRHEFLREYLAESADSPGGPDPRFADPSRPKTAHPAGIPDDLHSRLHQWAREWRGSSDAIDDFIGRFLSEPAASVFFDPPRALSLKRFVESGSSKGLRLDRRTRLLHRGRRFYINGESVAAPANRTALKQLRLLADAQRLDASQTAAALADPELCALLHHWALAGWLHPTRSRTHQSSTQFKP